MKFYTLVYLFFVFCGLQSLFCYQQKLQIGDICKYDYPAKVPSFGKEMMESFFHLDRNSSHLNCGSFGGAPFPVYDCYKKFFELCQFNPDEWYRGDDREHGMYKYTDYMDDVMKELSKYLNADEEDLVLVENTSTGINSVLRSLELSPKDGIIYLSFEFIMTKHVIHFIADRFGANLFVVDLPLPTTVEEILCKTADMLLKHQGEITLAVVDHVTSRPSMVLPLKKLIDMFHKYEIPVVVDGAQAMGHVPIDLKDLNPEYYISDMHKWFYAVASSAFLYVKKEYQDKMFPAVIGEYSFPDVHSFKKRFSWFGTRDFSATVSSVQSFKFREFVGNEKIFEHNNGLCRTAEKMFNEAWNKTSPVGPGMAASTSNIEIPCDLQTKECYSWTIDDLQHKLRLKKIYTDVYESREVRYIRISCQIYNKFSEYVVLKEAVEQIIPIRRY